MDKKQFRILSVFLGVMLAVSLVFSETAVFAKTGEKAGRETGGKISAEAGGLTLNQAISGSGDSGSEEKDPLEDTVVVLMENDSLTTETKVRKALSLGDEGVKDIKIEEVWNFDGAADTAKKDGQGLKLNDEGAAGQSQDEAVVALVSSDSMSAGKLAKKLNERDDVVLAEKNFKVHALGVTDDPYSDIQWSMKNNDNAPNVEYEWKEKGTTGSDKIVAVVDSGVDYTHPDLKDNMWVNTHRKIKGVHGFDFIEGDPDPMDENGHGTHCAGIIGAVGNNKEGISGVNQKIRIMALRILDADGSAWLSHEIAAYNYINMAIDLGEPVVAINNSWGGGEESEIFEKLIDIVGKKGAASIFAAGNDGMNLDEQPVYPANIDSPYILSVAATDRSGNLASYSNYGDTVDVAAPGSEILSSVPSESYNASLYGDRQSDVSAEFNSFTDDAETFGVPGTFYIDGEECEKSGDVFIGKNGQEIRVERADEGFTDGDTRSLKITYKGLKANNIVSYLLPYELEKDAKTRPALSLMDKVDAPKNASDLFSSTIFLIADISEDEVPDLDTLGDKMIAGHLLQGKAERWNHVSYMVGKEGEAGDKRRFCVSIFTAVDGDYTALIDDIGMSRQDIEKKAFGKYDFMSGTSMATPFITGAVALKIAEKEKQLKEGEKLDVADVLNEISAMSKDEPELEICPKGAFDFRLIPAVLPPRVGKATVDTKADTIKISGSGLFPDQPGFKVEVGKDDDHMKEAEIIPSKGAADGTEVLIKNDRWINNVENIRVTGAGGKTSKKNGLYLVSGKKEYTKKDGIDLELSSEATCTDGKYIYTAWSQTSEIKVQDISNNEEIEPLIEVDASKIFDTKKDENIKYGMLFGKDLVYLNGRLYNVVEYGAADETESADDMIWIFGRNRRSKTGKNKQKDEEEEEEESGSEEFEGPFAIYSGEYRLISVGTTEKDSKVKDLGKLPEALEDMESYTMASYNDKLYFIGGSNGYGENRTFSDKVFVFDPKTKKWKNGPSLPEGRAGGKALQCGSKLIYTLGDAPGLNDEPKDENDFSVKLPDNLIFDGSKWRACSVQNELVKMYDVDVLSVGLTAKGILYSGAPVNDYGDTFIYDVKQNKYVDTGYNYLSDPEVYGPTTVVIGKKLYGQTEDGVFTIPVESGLVNVTASKSGKGKIKGLGGYLPGNDAKITIKAAKKYYIKSLKVGGKKVKLSKKPTKKVYTIKKMTSDQKIKVVFAKKK